MNLEKLIGKIERSSGKISIKMDANFILSILSYYSFPKLIIKTELTNGKELTDFQYSKNELIQSNGYTVLVGKSIVPRTGNKILDGFFNLPNEALAELHCKLNDIE